MKKIILIPAFILFAVAAFSQERTPRVDARQATQQARIAQGQASGELNRGETRALRAEQRHIRRSEHRAKADGDVTVAERRRLDRKQDRANRHIRRAKNNNVN
ncbi:MAG TPA: hypothetical protein VFE50_03500 [Cyclobacteriaceae bacterium]|nr:hypothetical protein [Cyclobacteriaceae bacterium]